MENAFLAVATTLVVAVPVAVLSTPFDSVTASGSAPRVPNVTVTLVVPALVVLPAGDPATVQPYVNPARAGAVAVKAMPAVTLAGTETTGATAGAATRRVMDGEVALSPAPFASVTPMVIEPGESAWKVIESVVPPAETTPAEP